MNCKLALFVLFAALVWDAKAGAAEPRRITLGYSSIGPMATGFWMAKEIGAFEKHGIHAELIYISSGPVVIQALIGGDLQAGSAATNAVMNAILNGAPILGVAGTSNRPYHRLYVQPEINRMEDLRGKTLGVTRFGAISRRSHQRASVVRVLRSSSLMSGTIACSAIERMRMTRL